MSFDYGPDMGTVARRLIEKETLTNSGSRLPDIKELPDDKLEDDTDVTYEAEGVNFYLRLGAMGKW